MAVTNRGKKLILEWAFGRTARPAKFYIHLLTSATAPTVDTETLGDTGLTQIADGNGYSTGGYELTPGSTDFDSSSEDDGANKAIIQVKDIVWTASGNLPASGNGARYAVLTDNNVTVTSRQVIDFKDLQSDRAVSDGQTLTIQDYEIDATE